MHSISQQALMEHLLVRHYGEKMGIALALQALRIWQGRQADTADCIAAWEMVPKCCKNQQDAERVEGRLGFGAMGAAWENQEELAGKEG